jgi:murein DD-endopeptidase MepM/ murein hydrolase activator NlpD
LPRGWLLLAGWLWACAGLAAPSLQWPLAPAGSLPTVTQDYGCRGTATLIAGAVGDACERNGASIHPYHAGIDLVPTTSDWSVHVAAVENACAVGVTTCNGGWGNWVVIDHGGGLESLYAHLKQGSVTVAVGGTVTQGQAIGTVVATGAATGSHSPVGFLRSAVARLEPWLLQHGVGGPSATDSGQGALWE